MNRPYGYGQFSTAVSTESSGEKMSNEADTCRKFVLPKLMAAGWDNEPHSFTEQKTFTDGTIIVSGDKILRRPALQFEEFAACLSWWKHRKENDRTWKVSAAELLDNNCNLNRKNPRGKEDITHLPPEQLVESILQKEQRIMEIMGRIKSIMEKLV
jgi:hypothetical protein